MEGLAAYAEAAALAARVMAPTENAAAQEARCCVPVGPVDNLILSGRRPSVSEYGALAGCENGQGEIASECERPPVRKIETGRLTKRQLTDRIEPMKRKHLPLTDQLRQAVLNCGQSQAAICRATGIDKTALYRFVVSERGVSCAVMDTLGEYLGLRIVADTPRKRKGR